MSRGCTCGHVADHEEVLVEDAFGVWEPWAPCPEDDCPCLDLEESA